MLIVNLLAGWSMEEDFSLIVKMLLLPDILLHAMFLLEQEENQRVTTLSLHHQVVTWMKPMVMISLVKELKITTELLLLVMLMLLLMPIHGLKSKWVTITLALDSY
jgi:hypothetical protein